MNKFKTKLSIIISVFIIGINLMMSCSSKKISQNDHLYEKLFNFKDFDIIDRLELQLGDINADWESVIKASFNTLDKKLLFIDEDYTATVNSDYTECIKTATGKNINLDNSINTVIYSKKVVYDEEQYFEIYCTDFKKIKYGGDIGSVILSKPSENEIIRILTIKNKNLLLPEKKEIEYLFFEKNDNNVTLYHFLFKCPSNFNDFAFLSLRES